MAITPISQYRGQDNSLAQILKGGTDTIAGILNSAIQLGRDRVNNQMRQEDQMFQQRASETALAQRRGENLSSLIQDNQRMTLNQQNVDRQYDRLLNQDALAQSNADRQFGFNEDRDEFNRNVTNQELGFKQRDEQRDVVTDSLNQTGQRLQNAKYARDLAEPALPESEKPMSDSEERQRWQLEATRREKNAMGILSDRTLVADEIALNKAAVDKFAADNNLTYDDALKRMGSETQQTLASGFNQDQKRKNDIIASDTFEDFINKLREPAGGKTDEWKAKMKIAYDDIKFGTTPFGQQSNTASDELLPPKEVDPLDAARKYMNPSLGQ